MSEMRSLSRRYSDQQFKAANRIERISLYMRDSDIYSLSDPDHEYFELMKRTFAILSSQTDQKIRVDLISHISTPELPLPRVYNLINDTKVLFGDVVKVNKKFDRMVLREHFLQLARLAKEEEDYGEARRCFREAARIEELYDPDTEVFDPSAFELPTIIISSSPEAFYADAEVIEEEE